MRHFIVLGFKTSSNTEEGTVVHKGTDCQKAVASVNAPEKSYIRKELFELALPQIRKQLSTAAEAEAQAKAKAAAEAEARAKAEAEAAAASEAEEEAEAEAEADKG